jgi:gliding motility-associated-like protein
MKKIILILSLIIWVNSSAQNEAANWFFGQNAGIQFDNTGSLIGSVNGGQLSTLEGCTTISDTNGNLLFYTDGNLVYNRNHELMPNGTGLFGNSSSTQSALVVPEPGSDTIFYIFTVDTFIGGPDPDNGFNYSIVDMTLDGGLGDITSLNINLLQDTSEKVTAVLKDCISESIWVIALGNEDGTPTTVFNTYHAFEVSTTGVNTTAIKSTFPTIIGDQRGQMKASPNGKKLASANSSAGLFLYDFDANTGMLSNQQALSIASFSPFSYGVEFSQNSLRLYVHSSNNGAAAIGTPPSDHQSTLSQFDLAATDIQGSRVTLDQRQLYRGSLQLGPDGKIYRALTATYDDDPARTDDGGLPFLGVIENPNVLGIAANYIHNAVDLSPNVSTQGLPPFIQSFFNDQIDIIQNGISSTELSLCIGENYTLAYEDITGAVYTWMKDGVLLSESDFDLVVTGPGVYTLNIEFNNGACETFDGEAIVAYFEVPVANQPNDINICDDDNDGKWSFDFSSQDADVFGAQDPLVFEVKYFESQTDADNNVNEIVSPYINITSQQEIFVKIQNIGYYGCFDTTSFNIEVFNTPTANPVADVEVCDDDIDSNDTNGQVTTDLSDVDAIVLGTQDTADYNITYHSSQLDADSGANILPTTYYNTVPNTQEIFVRIENILNTDCYDTTSFNIIVNPLPVVFDSLLFQCDYDGNPDGFTLFNLTEAHDVLTGSVSDLSTQFYLSLADAQGDMDEINGTSFSNTVNPQIISVRVVNDITGCYRLTELILDVSATTVNGAALFECDTDGIEDGFFEFDLSEANTTVLGGTPPGVTLSYYATSEDALLEVNPLPLNFTNTIANFQTIFVRAENDNACYGINQVDLTIYDLPNIEIEDKTIYCLNTFPETITLNAGLNSGNLNDFTYSWSSGENTYEIEINGAGTYSVTVTNVNGCSKERTITVLPSNIATINNIDVVDATSNNIITVLVSGEGDYEFAIDNIIGPYQDGNVFENVSPGLHTVYIRDKNNCGIVENIVSVIGFPKFFTPNGDGYHDTWQVYGLNHSSQLESIVYIFDRFGKLVKQLSPTGIGWDGTFNGQPLPTSDYWFHVKLQDGRTFKSHFTLKH